jgi:chemotaxis protein methyltransferase CheR
MDNSIYRRPEIAMTQILSPRFDPPELSDRDLAAIVRLVHEKSGISLHAGKRALVTARLQKRLRQCGVDGFRAYVRHLQADSSGAEITAMLDAIATNHTAFFREPQHFRFLGDVVLPPLMARPDSMPIRGWSAACSTGEEPYTIVMTAIERCGDDAARRLRVLASDLSTKALSRADAGIYKAERIEELPRHLALKYFDKPAPGFVRIVKPLRRLVEFQHLNLLDAPPPGPPMDFIFCRNVMIYFDRDVQQRVLDRLQERLTPGGFLFTSHSETLTSLRHNLEWIAPSVYQRGRR